MLSKLFSRSQKPKYYHSFLKESDQEKTIESILVTDSSGILLYSYTNPEIETTIDSSLISMFITAISNFSKEIFRYGSGTSITINRGKYIISLDSNSKLCVALIGTYNPQNLFSKLKNVIEKISKLYGRGIQPYEENKEYEIQKIITEEFFT